MDNRKIIVNGKEYASIDDVPEQYRALVKEAQEKAGSGSPVHFAVHKTFKFKVNGKEYDSINEMPEAARKLFADKNVNGVPDILENLPDAGSGSPVVRQVPANQQPNMPVLVKEGSSGRGFLVVTLLAAAVILIYFLFLK